MGRYGSSTTILGRLPSGLTVTMLLYKASDGSSVAITNTCNEIGSTGVYRWATSNITTQPTTETEYYYRMVTGDYQYGGKFSLISKIDAVYDRVGTPAGASIAADLAAAQTDLDNPDQYKASVANVALEATLTAMKGATFVEGTDSLEAIRDRGDAAWATATGFSVPNEYDVAIASLQTDLTFIRNEAGGKWEIVGDQMIFYKENGTELMRFNLFDDAGQPTMQNVYKRERVP